MPDNSNNPINFWQELKRRKVIRVITVYAAASFVIIELISNTWEPFGLPDWTLRFVFVILCIGLIISIILSWIYDIHPEGDIVKTEPAHKAKIEEIPKSSSGWKIASYISFVVIVALIVLNIFPRSSRKDILDKSIAVLPFRNDSPDEEKMYFINGTMESILDNLCKIEDLRVISRTSIEQYRNNPKPTPEIAEELNVSYVLEGSGLKDGDNIRLTVQLIYALNDEHLWSNTYNRQNHEIFAMQSEIAQLVAREIEAVITPEEKQLIEKIPTYNLTAYELYQRGREDHIKYWLDYDDTEAHERAEYFYNKALEEDPTFAKAYTGLTLIYSENNYLSRYEQNILDSILARTEFALSLDDQEEEAYRIRALTYGRKGDYKKAKENYEIALNINPNYALGLRSAGLFYLFELNDYVKGFSNFHKAASIDRSPYLSVILRSLADAYTQFGFVDNAILYIQEATKLDNDSIKYYLQLSHIEYTRSNHIDVLNYRLKAYMIDSNNTQVINFLASSIGSQGRYEESLRYWEKYLALKKTRGEQIVYNVYSKIGNAYWENGYKEEAKYYFNEQINICNQIIELGVSNYQSIVCYLRLAQAYARLGDKDQALENLRILNQKERLPAMVVTQIKKTRYFNNIRDDHEFQLIVSDLEAKYEAERDRVKKWLEENDML